MSQKQILAQIVSVDQITDDIYRISLHAPAIANSAMPGQFVMVRTSVGHDPLLRRPFSIHDVPEPDQISLLYKVVGKGTRLLSQFTVGEELNIVGPLGNYFSFSEKTNAVLVGGGLGIAPLLFLTRKLLDKVAASNILVLLGAQNEADVKPFAQEISALGVTTKCATDDGSFGFHGFVTEIFPEPCESNTVFVCGPNPLMAAMSVKCETLDIPCQASLEAHMACGLGACLGCTIVASDFSYKHVCKHGPVFDAREVLWTL